MAMTMRGVRADVRHVYHAAAQLGPWSIEGSRLSAEVRSVDTFRVSQQPLTLIVTLGNGHTWRYAMTDVTVSGGHLEATVTLEG